MRVPISSITPLLRRGMVFLLLVSAMGLVAAAQAQYHVLEKGETLYSVARSYGLEASVLAKANDIDDPSKLRVGRKLLIPLTADQAQPAQTPQPATHRVAKGETLFSIARSSRVSLDELRAANKLGPSSVIKAGDLLILPAGAPQAKPAAATATPAGVAATAAAVPGGTKDGSSPAGVAASKEASRPTQPEAVKTSAKTADKAISWPCPGEIRYLDGKAYGVVIRAKLGESMKAVASGTVSSAGPYRGYGNVVFVLSHGYIYVYGGNENISVRAGDQVGSGQELGKVGIDAKLGGPTAYFLVFKSGAAVDPATAPRD